MKNKLRYTETEIKTDNSLPLWKELRYESDKPIYVEDNLHHKEIVLGI